MARYILVRTSTGARLELSGTMIIGRSEECDIVLTEGHPSRRHARITIDGGNVWLEDLSSANGTFVNDRQISEKVLLQNGDNLSFDIDRFVFESDEAVAEDVTVIRRLPPEDSDATVMRRVEPLPTTPAAVEPPAPEPEPPAREPEPEPEPEPPPPPPPPEPEPAAPAPQAAPAAQVPRSWADPEFQAEQGTRMLTAEEMRAMASASAAASVDVSEPQLIVTSGASAGLSLTLGAGEDGEWIVGTENSDLQLSDAGISATHAKLSCENGRWRIIDQMSANGTFVNGHKSIVSFLSSGDTIKFGPVECTIALPAAPAKRKKAAKSRSGGDKNKTRPRTESNEDAYKLIEVLYVTDRARKRFSKKSLGFSGKRDSRRTSHFGAVLVSIPGKAKHKIGRIERPKWYRLQFREKASDHFTAVGIDRLGEHEFYELLKDRLSSSQFRQAFLFIHGYNVSFRSAVFRTAQLANDLKFDGPAITYSWPSAGSLAGYLTDANNVEWTIPHLRQTLENVNGVSHAEVIHIVAHSMGNRALLRALSEIDSVTGVGEVVLAAPDVDQDVFRELVSGFIGRVSRVTLYASSNDEALTHSKKVQGGYPRAGDTEDSIVVMPPMDTIDASAVSTGLWGHSYFADERTIVSDVFSVITEDKNPGQRFGMSEVETDRGNYWSFDP